MYYSTNKLIHRTKHDGFAIALAWPETLCKQAGAWYDHLLYYAGINRKGYYKVGHAAIVLVDDETQSCRYFDFGRYHAPHGYGRVRSEKTDHELNIKIKASISNEQREINNLNEILSELHSNASTHGSGTIYGVATRIDFNKALSFAIQLQDKDFNPYGPFLSNGTNCSRFVNSVIRAGNPALVQRMKLQYPLTFSPTPMWNLRAIGGTISSIGPSYRKVEDVLIKQEPELITVS